MGTYLNPGKKSFEIASNSEIYVDKTGMLEYLNSIVNTSQRYAAVSRPRRFGKSTTANMICAYYDRTAGSRALFEKRKLSECADWDKYLGKFDVIRITMTDFITENFTVEQALNFLSEEVISELQEEYPEVKYGSFNVLRTACSKVFNHTKRSFVIVIDEWDSIFREKKEDKEELLSEVFKRLVKG